MNNTDIIQKLIDNLPEGEDELIEEITRQPQPPKRMIDEIAPLVTERLDGFPTRYEDTDILSGDKWFDAFRICLQIVRRGGVALLTGTRGGGKTRIAYEVARRALIPKKSGDARICRTALMIFLEIRSTYSPKSKLSELEVIKSFCECRLLVIDEVQERRESPSENSALTAIIDERYRHRLPTILIANLEPKDFQTHLGPSIVDRANEDGGMVICDWPSFRTTSNQTNV